MTPTLDRGAHFRVKRGTEGLCRGDVVVYKAYQKDSQTIHFVSRVIASAGDTVGLEGGTLMVNGRAVHYIDSATDYSISAQAFVGPGTRKHKPALAGGSITVPVGHVFVVGDNPPMSYDSRYWGSLSMERIVGVVVE